MPIRTNPLKAPLCSGQAKLGTWITISRNPAIIHLLKSVGLDFVQVDMEHCPPSIETVADIAMAGRALDLPVLVRPPVANREWISRILDAGAWGIYAAQIETPEQAHEVVVASRHWPLGNRGTFEPGPQNDYTAPDDLQFLNEQVHVTIMLESKRAFENLDELVSMDGIDAVGLGAFDLAQDLGIYGDASMSAIIDEYRSRLSECASKSGKAFSIYVETVDDIRKWTRAGAGLVCFQTDAGVIRTSFVDAMKKFRGMARPAR